MTRTYLLHGILTYICSIGSSGNNGEAGLRARRQLFSGGLTMSLKLMGYNYQRCFVVWPAVMHGKSEAGMGAWDLQEGAVDQERETQHL